MPVALPTTCAIAYGSYAGQQPISSILRGAEWSKHINIGPVIQEWIGHFTNTIRNLNHKSILPQLGN